MAGDSDEVGIRHIYISTYISKNKRAKWKSTYYHVKDTTLIQSISLKNLLSNIKKKSRTNNMYSCKDYIDKHAEVVIVSLDTVIFLMMVQMYPSLPYDISFLTGKGNLKRNILAQPLYNKLRYISASSILGFHDQIRSDMSGRFAGRTYLMI